MCVKNTILGHAAKMDFIVLLTKLKDHFNSPITKFTQMQTEFGIHTIAS